MIGCVVLAAGKSTRMGRPKLRLAWGNTTVIRKVVATLILARVDEIVVVTGGDHHQVEEALVDLPLRCIYNPQYADGEMLVSFKVGLASLSAEIETCLVTLGDQPQIESPVVEGLLKIYRETNGGIIVPSYGRRRGHPWLLHKQYWMEVFAIRPPGTLKDFLNAHEQEIIYLNVSTPSILFDLDTPQDYQKYRPK